MSSLSWSSGILLFPMVILASLISRFAEQAFFIAADSPDSVIGADVVWFILQMISFWGGILIAVVVLVCLLADLQSHKEERTQSTTAFWGLAGAIHLGGAIFIELLLISAPALSYYVYQRRTGR